MLVQVLPAIFGTKFQILWEPKLKNSNQTHIFISRPYFSDQTRAGIFQQSQICCEVLNIFRLLLKIWFYFQTFKNSNPQERSGKHLKLKVSVSEKKFRLRYQYRIRLWFQSYTNLPTLPYNFFTFLMQFLLHFVYPTRLLGLYLISKFSTLLVYEI